MMTNTVTEGYLTALGINFSTISVFVFVFLLTLILYQLLSAKNKKQPLPPGPKGWPIVGCIPYLAGKDTRKVLAKYVEQFGDIYSIQMGSETVVLLNSVDAIKEAFVQMGHIFSERPHLLFIDYITEGKGIISSNGKSWKEHRHFTHTVLKDFGMGRPMLEDKIHDGISLMLMELEKRNMKAFDVHHLLMLTVATVTHKIVVGKSYDYDDPFFEFMMAVFERSFKILSNSGVLNFFPYLMHLPGDWFQIHSVLKFRDIIRNAYREMCKEHLDTLDPHSDRDYVDVYLKRLQSAKEDGEETTLSFDQLVAVLGDLFSAGAETTSTTLKWGFVYLLHYPEVQRKLQKEIDDVIGSSRNPSMIDRQNMPYTEAYIAELQRSADIIPFGVPHATASDVTFRGYHIPKGTQVWPNLYYVHYNKKYWGDPEKFRPERFIDSDGKFQKPHSLLPFSIGRRVCLGESLARMELFLFTTSILQKFTVLPPVDETLPPFEGILGISYAPQRFKLRFEKR